jgi:phage shock protein C
MKPYAFEEGRAPLIDFRRDTERGLLLGVCAGLAERCGWDLTVIRLVTLLALVVATLPTVLLYLAVGLLTPPQRLTYYGRQERTLWRRCARRARGMER